MNPSAARAQPTLKERGSEGQVGEMPARTRTAQDAALAVGCAVGQIAKSLIFRGRDSGEAILVIASGANRVNEKTLAGVAGGAIERADPGFVHAQPGVAIGGVAAGGAK